MPKIAADAEILQAVDLINTLLDEIAKINSVCRGVAMSISGGGKTIWLNEQDEEQRKRLHAILVSMRGRRVKNVQALLRKYPIQLSEAEQAILDCDEKPRQ